MRRQEVLGCVLVFRVVAAAHVAAAHAEPQVDPRVAHVETFFAAVGRTWLDFANLQDVSAQRSRHQPSSLVTRLLLHARATACSMVIAWPSVQASSSASPAR